MLGVWEEERSGFIPKCSRSSCVCCDHQCSTHSPGACISNATSPGDLTITLFVEARNWEMRHRLAFTLSVEARSWKYWVSSNPDVRSYGEVLLSIGSLCLHRSLARGPRLLCNQTSVLDGIQTNISKLFSSFVSRCTMYIWQ